MSSPQPPENQPGQGGGQPPQSSDPALAGSGPTQVVQPGQPGTGSHPVQDSSQASPQAVRPGQPDATQVVPPGQAMPNYGQYTSAAQQPPQQPGQPGWGG